MKMGITVVLCLVIVGGLIYLRIKNAGQNDGKAVAKAI
jgi:hypothetical protein